jgi:hypothetical protein
LARLVADADLRRAMGAAGRARIEAEFALDSCAAAYARFYRTL